MRASLVRFSTQTRWQLRCTRYWQSWISPVIDPFISHIHLYYLNISFPIHSTFSGKRDFCLVISHSPPLSTTAIRHSRLGCWHCRASSQTYLSELCLKLVSQNCGPICCSEFVVSTPNSYPHVEIRDCFSCRGSEGARSTCRVFGVVRIPHTEVHFNYIPAAELNTKQGKAWEIFSST